MKWACTSWSGRAVGAGDAKVTVLSEYIKHHVKEEQNEMFPKVRKSKLRLKQLGKQRKTRKEQLMEQMGA